MNRPFLLAVASCLGLGAAFYGSVYVVTSDVHLSEGLGALPLIAIHSLAEGIEKRGANARKSNAYAKSYSFDKYMIRWFWILLVGVAAIVAMANLISLFAGLMLLANASASNDARMATLGGIVLIPSVAFAYALGRWAGVRSQRGGWLLVFAYSALASALMHLSDYLFADNATFALFFGGQTKSLGVLANQIFAGVVLYGLPGLAGFWRGRRVQQDAYLAHLMRLLPRDTRELVTSMIVDEVGRLPTTPPKPAATAPAPAVALGAQTP
jgi:hypothetical protein